jgi:RNA polymerase sigma factor (sigma-70 family)
MAVLGFLSTRPRRAPAAPGQAGPGAAAATARGAAATADWPQWHAARQGSATAAVALVQGLSGQAYGLALRLLGRAEDAEDVVQEAFMRLWRSDPKDDQGATLSTYFNTIVINRCRSLLVARREWATDPADLQDLQETAPDGGYPQPGLGSGFGSGAGASLDTLQRKAAIEQALRRLPARQRLVLALWAYAERSVPEIAAELELGADATHQLLTRAKRSLRLHLSPELL